MTSGERMVWAAAFEQGLGRRYDGIVAASWAASSVMIMRAIARSPDLRAMLTDDALAMLDDMLGAGENRNARDARALEPHALSGDGVAVRP